MLRKKEAGGWGGGNHEAHHGPPSGAPPKISLTSHRTAWLIRSHFGSGHVGPSRGELFSLRPLMQRRRSRSSRRSTCPSPSAVGPAAGSPDSREASERLQRVIADLVTLDEQSRALGLANTAAWDTMHATLVALAEDVATLRRLVLSLARRVSDLEEEAQAHRQRSGPVYHCSL